MRRTIGFVGLAAIAASLAALAVYSLLEKQQEEIRRATLKTVEIVVAARDFEVGSKIEPGSVKLARWPRDAVPPGAYTDPGQIISVYVRRPLVQDEPIVANQLFRGEKAGGVMPFLIPRGMRAMAVPVDEVSDIAGFVMPHTRVDVLVAISGGGPNEKPRSKTVLENAEVLATAQEIEEQGNKPHVVKVVTLLVTPEEAERLALAGREGTLRLAMRSYNDRNLVLTSGVDLAGLFNSYTPLVRTQTQTRVLARHAASPPPPEKIEVEVMRDGTAAQPVSFVSDGSAGQWLPLPVHDHAAGVPSNGTVTANENAEPAADATDHHDGFDHALAHDGTDGAPGTGSEAVPKTVEIH